MSREPEPVELGVDGADDEGGVGAEGETLAGAEDPAVGAEDGTFGEGAGIIGEEAGTIGEEAGIIG